MMRTIPAMSDAVSDSARKLTTISTVSRRSTRISRKGTEPERKLTVTAGAPRKLTAADLLPDGSSGWIAPRLSGKDMPEEAEVEEEQKSPWGSLWLCNFVQFLCGIQFAIYFTSMWPFLTGMDPHVDFGFFGIIVAVFSIGQTVASPAFGWWSQKTRSTKWPSIFGLLLSAIGNLLYALLPTIKTNPKWWMMVARILVGIGSGNLGVLRAYTSTASVYEDRNKAMALGIASFVFGQSLGPALQAIFSPIGAAGVWLGTAQFNMYTVPAYVMIVLSVISTLLLLFCFEESYAGIMTIDEEKDPYVVLPKFDKVAAIVLIYMWYVQQSIVTTIEVMASPLTIAMFNWNDSEAILYNGLIQSASCVFSVANYFAIAYTRIGKIGNRKMIIFSLILFMIHYLLNTPWPFYPEKMNFIEVNGTFTDSTTEEGGCYQRYKWCSWTSRTPIYVYAFSATFIFGLAFPYFATPSGTIYSQVLGPRNQGFMQGIFAFFGSIARTIGPLITTNLFERYGYLYPNLVQFIQILIAFALSIVFYRRLVPLRMVPKVGKFAKYKKGVFTHL